MKRISTYIAALAMLLAAGGAKAQTLDAGGLIVDPAAMNMMDMFNLSQSNFNFGTARSAAMAGAFTSLGADMVSMSINPAGLGMYRRNELSVTPMLNFNRSTTDAGSFERSGGTRFGFANTGLVIKVRESDTGVTAINLGFSFNRIADYNYRYSFSVRDAGSTVADLYSRQLRDAGVTKGALGDSFDWGDFSPSLWGATLGYFSGMINDPNNDGSWQRDMIGADPVVNQMATLVSRGSANEFLISMGMNLGNKLYLGASLGIQSVSLRRDIYYGENYSYAADPALDYRMDYFNYDQWAKISGSGVNFKIGAVYRPVAGLRIGVAFHTPTFYSLVYKYKAGMTSQVQITDIAKEEAKPEADRYTYDRNGYLDPPFSNSTPTLVDDGDNNWNFSSPARLLVGVSYTFGRMAVVSVDYQRDWYRGIRAVSTPFGEEMDERYNNFARDCFRGSNTLRVGAEIKPLPQMAIRAGYGLWMSALKDTSLIYSTPMTYRTDYASAGLGFVLSKSWFLDLAYQYMHNRMTPYKTWYYSGDGEGASPTFKTETDKHLAMLTLGCRF